MIQFKRFLVAGTLLWGFAACSSNEIGNSKDVAAETVYQQYDIKYTESGGPKVTLTAQFRFGGSNGTTLLLNNPSNIALDGQVLKVDSSKYSGAFYEVEKSAGQFTGSHRYVFTDINGKKYENSFVFQPLRLMQAPTTASRKQTLELAFETSTLMQGDVIEVSTTGSDSTFSITQDVSNLQNKLHIPAKEMGRQKNDRLLLDITLRRDNALQQKTNEGGEISMRQHLKTLSIKLTD